MPRTPSVTVLCTPESKWMQWLVSGAEWHGRAGGGVRVSNRDASQTRDYCVQNTRRVVRLAQIPRRAKIALLGMTKQNQGPSLRSG